VILAIRHGAAAPAIVFRGQRATGAVAGRFPVDVRAAHSLPSRPARSDHRGARGCTSACSPGIQLFRERNIIPRKSATQDRKLRRVGCRLRNSLDREVLWSCDVGRDRVAIGIQVVWRTTSRERATGTRRRLGGSVRSICAGQSGYGTELALSQFLPYVVLCISLGSAFCGKYPRNRDQFCADPSEF